MHLRFLPPIHTRRNQPFQIQIFLVILKPEVIAPAYNTSISHFVNAWLTNYLSQCRGASVRSCSIDLCQVDNDKPRINWFYYQSPRAPTSLIGGSTLTRQAPGFATSSSPPRQGSSVRRLGQAILKRRAQCVAEPEVANRTLARILETYRMPPRTSTGLSTQASRLSGGTGTT